MTVHSLLSDSLNNHHSLGVVYWSGGNQQKVAVRCSGLYNVSGARDACERRVQVQVIEFNVA